MIDSHCHLADPQFDADLETVVRKAHAVGVSKMMCISDTLDEAQKCLTIARRFEHIYCTIGVHPHHASAFDISRDIPHMRAFARDQNCKAIGEIGLDYHYDNSPRDVQQRVFEAQLTLAKELGLPAVVHCRDAVEDVWIILRRVHHAAVVIHCCTEKWADIEKFVQAGYFLSFTGIATYSGSTEICRTIELCPLDQMMIETDSPYLAPEPYRGQRNEPAYLMSIARKICDIRRLSSQDFDTQMTKNTEKFFRLILS